MRQIAVISLLRPSKEHRKDNVEPIFDYPRTGTAGEPPFVVISVAEEYVYRDAAFFDYGGDLSRTFLFADFWVGQPADRFIPR